MNIIDKTVLHYKIVEKIAEGGMGEIYKAFDTSLERFVALKFLPPHFSDTEEEKTRFITEAKTASSLNHPNICTIHAIHEFNNEEGMKQFFIVMEFIEGKTLKDSKRILSVKEIIDIGIQIAEGLTAAHEKGIIHRDIKPENIMLMKDGRIQIMDFGLAKFTSDSKVSRLTKIGTTMGTLGYMSPEQVQGYDVDYRTDLFSSGVVLYEQLTGESPFKGLHNAAVIYKIINSDALPPSALRNDIDPLLDLVILKCLEKDRERRYQSSKEFAEDLKNLKHLYHKEAIQIDKLKKKLLNSVKPKRKTIISPSGSIKLERAYGKYMWIALVFFLVTLTVLYYIFLNQKSIPVNPDMKIEELLTSFTDISIPSMSSDGNWIAFPASDQNDKWDIYLMHSTVREPRKISNDFASYIHYAIISPDGGEILFNIENDLFIIPSTGGIKKRIAQNVISCGWRPDCQQIGFVEQHYPQYNSISFWTMNPDGTNKKLVYTDQWGLNGRFSFSYSPDGNSIVHMRFFNDGYNELFIRNLTTGKETQLTYDKSNIEDQKWTEKGLILYSSNKGGDMNIWTLPEKGGDPVQLTKGNGPDMELSASADLKKILYYQLRDYSNMWLGDLERNKFKQITFDERLITDPAISPDHKRIAFSLHKPAPEAYTQIYIMDRDGNNLRQLSFNKSNKGSLIFSPDGKLLAYTEYQTNNNNNIGKVYIINTESPDAPIYLGIGKAEIWLNNSSVVIINNINSEVVSIDGGKKERLYSDSTLAVPVALGKSILYLDLHSNDFGKYYLAKHDNSVFPKYIFSEGDYVSTIVNNNFIYAENYNNEIWRYSCFSGNKEKIGYFVNLMSYWGLGFNISSDDKEIVYVEHKRSTKFVMIENAFTDK